MVLVGSELVDSWCRRLRSRNRSPATIAAYRADVAHLEAYLAPRDVTTATTRDLEDFLAAGLESGLAAATVARRYRSLLQFFTWLAEEEEIDANPMAKMKPPRVPVDPPDVISADELRRLLAACAGKTFEDRRDTAMIRLLATTGIRASELMGLHVGDVDLARDQFTVLGKGSKVRRVALLPKPADAVDRYIRIRRKHPQAHLDWLWIGDRGRLTDSGLRQMLERRTTKAGIGHINPHRFRHTFAHEAKLRGMPDDALMAIAGWESPQMLQRYGASAVQDRALDAHRRLFAED